MLKEERHTHILTALGKKGKVNLESLSKSLKVSEDTVRRASETERARWSLGDTVTLRGHDHPTRLASPG